MPKKVPTNPILVIVTDGLGYDLQKEQCILKAVYKRLGLMDTLQRIFGKTDLVPSPIYAESIPPNTKTDLAKDWLYKCDEFFREIDQSVFIKALEKEALDKRYVPYVKHSNEAALFRNKHLSIPTHASGEWVGFEKNDLVPTQGNSETGHQHLANASIAYQTSMQITNSIKNGDFFVSGVVFDLLKKAKKEGTEVVVSFMLSGMDGGDGRVHSSWEHLLAFLKLSFEVLGVSQSRLKLLIVLDGRDSPTNGSIERGDGKDGYLYELRKVLSTYSANDCLSWVVGRNYAMDRDYQEENTKLTYELLLGKAKKVLSGFDELILNVKTWHSGGGSDSGLPPIAIGGNKKISKGSLFINLNFRSDRQNAISGALLYDKAFLNAQSVSRKRPKWDLSWLEDLKVSYCAIAEYNKGFSKHKNYWVAYKSDPLKDNLLLHYSMYSARQGKKRYLLVAESIKSSHMGYFVRGRRDHEFEKGVEKRVIVPSLSHEAGVNSDSDIHKFPKMQVKQVAEAVLEGLSTNEFGLIMCNLAPTDMVGHLLPKRFDEAVMAYTFTTQYATLLSNRALSLGYGVVWTSDHGNIEADTPSHTTNPVLTTLATPGTKEYDCALDQYQARLNDVAVSVASLIGFKIGTDAKSQGRFLLK